MQWLAASRQTAILIPKTLGTMLGLDITNWKMQNNICQSFSVIPSGQHSDTMSTKKSSKITDSCQVIEYAWPTIHIWMDAEQKVKCHLCVAPAHPSGTKVSKVLVLTRVLHKNIRTANLRQDWPKVVWNAEDVAGKPALDPHIPVGIVRQVVKKANEWRKMTSWHVQKRHSVYKARAV